MYMWWLPQSGQVWILDYTYANFVDQTSARIFYAFSSAENLLIFGADVSNAFAEAPPPKQGFYIQPDKTLLTLLAWSFLFFWQCRATPNPHIFGRSMLTKFFARLAYSLQPKNLASIWVWLKATVSCSSAKLTTLPLLALTNPLQTAFLTFPMTNLQFWWSVWAFLIDTTVRMSFRHVTWSRSTAPLLSRKFHRNISCHGWSPLTYQLVALPSTQQGIIHEDVS